MVKILKAKHDTLRVIFTKYNENEAQESGASDNNVKMQGNLTPLTLEAMQQYDIICLKYCNRSAKPENEDPYEEDKDEGSESESDSTYSIKGHLGLTLPMVYEKTKRVRLSPMICPFVECNRAFQETGNLKTHLRIHVSYSHS